MKKLALFLVLVGLGLPVLASVDIPLFEKGTDVFYLNGSIEGIGDTEFLLDTGAGYMAIDDSTLKALKKTSGAKFQRSLNSRMANGWISKVDIYLLSSISLGNNCVLKNVEAAVVPGLSRNILGMNVLKQTGQFSVSFAPLTLTVGNCNSTEPA